MKTTTVYGKPSCVRCNVTYRALDQQGVSYQKIDVTQDAEALAYIQSLGYTQAPVVVTANEHWSGFRPDKIGALWATLLVPMRDRPFLKPGEGWRF